MKKNLLISFSRDSTGEVRLWVTGTKLLQEKNENIDLIINHKFIDLFSDFTGKLILYDFKSRNSWKQLYEMISMNIQKYKKIVFLDLTSATLENNFNPKDLSGIITDCLKLTNMCQIAFFDVMGVMEHSSLNYDCRVESTIKKLDAFCNQYNKINGVSSDQRSYYFSRFLKVRTVNQLLLVPKDIEIIRAVPYTHPKNKDNEEKTYFHFKSEKICSTNKKQNKIVMGFSMFAERSVSKEALSDMLDYVVKLLYRHVGIEEIILINPIGVEIKCHDNVTIQNYDRLERNKMLSEMKDAYFVAFFIPTASVGITAIQNGIPFISFYSSVFSSDYIKHSKKDSFIPKFKSLGIWEDAAFIDELTEEGNSYFNATELVDISDEKQFVKLNNDLKTGIIDEKIYQYNKTDVEYVKTLNEIIG